MRSFYDVYILLKLQSHTIDNKLLTKALFSTAKKRGSIKLLYDGELIHKEVFLDKSSYSHWGRYQRKYTYANDILWKDIEASVIELWIALGINLEDN